MSAEAENLGDPEATPASSDPRRRRALGLVASIIAAFGHISLVLAATIYFDGDTSATLTALALAPFATAVFRPHARRRGWHRWLSVWALSIVVSAPFFLPTLVVAEAWVLYRFWVVEAGSGTGPVRQQ